MLVLLPPSEGKTPADDGAPPLDLHRLTAPGLTPVRERVLDALAQVSARPDALEVLGVGAGVAREVARNVVVRTAPAAPARHVYSGVLFAAARLGEIEGAALERAGDHVRVVSALWGLVSPLDEVPAYRLSMDRDLPGVGPLARAWRAPLAAELDPAAAERLVVDCRSATYQAAWRPGRDARSWVTVRVVRDGRVVSHAAKHTRGVLTGHLVTRPGPPPQDAAELLEAARELVDATPPEPSSATAGSARRRTVPAPRVVDVALHDGPGASRVLELAVR